MADRCDRWEDNAPGRFYVDRECIVCTVCSDLAPANFRLSRFEDHDVCFQQPTTQDQVKQCLSAKDSCPVEAIGGDG